jgi:hypothetical protein
MIDTQGAMAPATNTTAVHTGTAEDWLHVRASNPARSERPEILLAALALLPGRRDVTNTLA